MNFAMYNLFSDTVIKHGWEAAADYAVGLGCSFVEILDGAVPTQSRLIKSVEDATAAREILKSRNLGVACYSVFANLYDSPGELDVMKTHAEYAAAIGSPYLHHTVLPWFNPDEPRPAFEQGISVGADAAEQIANHAAKFGITCLYEPQGFFLNGVDGLGIFLNEMKRRCKNVGVCADMGNTQFVDVPAEEVFRAFAEDIRHVHVKDYYRKTGSECPGTGWYKTLGGAWVCESPAGKGTVNIDACMDVLNKINYTGPFAIEMYDIEDTIRYMKKYE